jgi:DnaD/phage-associated family protein
MAEDRRPFDPKTTTFTNVALDEIMPRISPSAWKVLCLAIRKTAGWADPQSASGRKESDVISLSQFMSGCGISRNTAMTAIAECTTAGYLVRIPDGISYRYSLNLVYTLPETGAKIEPVQELDWRENRADTGAKIAPIDADTGAKIAPILARKSRTQTLINPNSPFNTKDNCNVVSSSFSAEAVKQYESTVGMVSGAHQAEDIDDMLKQLEAKHVEPWWSAALQIAADQNKRSWAYVRAILVNCLRDGKAPVGRNVKTMTGPPQRRMVKLADGTMVEAIA